MADNFEGDRIDPITKVKDLILKHYDPAENGDYYWDNGRPDDIFDAGVRSGYCDALYDIGQILGMDLPEKEKTELESN